MSDETTEPILDPISTLAVELENLKKEVKDTRNAIAEKDKQMAQMMNANKRLVAELSASKASPTTSPKIDSEQVAYKAFRNKLTM